MRSATAAGAGLAVFALALALRLVSLPTAFRGGHPQLVPLDDLYHAKRIIFSAAHFPRVLDRDQDRGLEGSFCPWPPLYDLALGGGARLLGERGAREVLRAVIWFPPLFTSAFALLATVFLARRAGLAAGVTAGLAIALSPSLAGASRLGTIDHHFLEPALAAAIAAAAIGTLEAGTGARSVWKRALLFALALTAALFVQTAMLFVAGLALAAVLLAGRNHEAFSSAALGFALAAAAVLVYRAGRPPGYPDDAWYLGTAHAAALLAGAVACGVAAWACVAEIRRAGRALGPLLGIAVGGLVAASIPGALSGIAQGTGFFGGDPWLREIQEFRPLFRGTWLNVLGDFFELGGGALLAVPFAFLSLRAGSPARRVLSVFAIGLLLAAIGSSRLTVPAAAILAIPAALLVSDQVRDRRFGRAGALAALAVAPGLIGCLYALPEMRSVVPPAAVPMLAAADFLKARREPGRVLAPWWAGHAFDVVSGRPVVLDNFGAMEGRALFDEAIGLPLSPREETVARYCRDHGVRFVAIENPVGAVLQTARMLEVPVSFYLKPVSTPAGGKPSYSPTRLLQASFWWRAYLGGELRPGDSQPGPRFRHFRLLYPDPSRFGDRLPPGSRALQVWEFLPPGS